MQEPLIPQQVVQPAFLPFAVVMPSCYTCDRTFRSPRALQDHCEAKAHCTPWNCIPGQRTFVNVDALYPHLEYSTPHRNTHDSESESDESLDIKSEDGNLLGYCDSCSGWFVDTTSLYYHLAENPKHRWRFTLPPPGLSIETESDQHSRPETHAVEHKHTFDCPLCLKMFSLPSSIAQHIESGCHKITRHQVTAAVHSLKVAPTISISHRLEGSTTDVPSIVTYTATERSFNGVAYECYLCHRTFIKLASLNSHLNSAAHDSDQFKCPKCKGKFALISGLIQHIESECCGIARFQQVMSEAGLLTDSFTKLLLT